MSGLFLPESFSSNEPPERIFGWETEYDIRTLEGRNQLALDNIEPWLDMWFNEDNLAALGLSAVALNNKRYQWLSNGAYVYPDVGHLEYCTPESLGPYEATLAAHAGNIVLARLLSLSGSQEQVFRRSATVNMATGDIVTKGLHRNFCIPDYITGGNFAPLETLAATQWYAWGGIATKQGFDIAPKARDIGLNVTSSLGNRTARGNKPFAIIRSAQGGGDADTNLKEHGLGRYEDRTGTPSSPWSDFMGLATFSLMLRVREHPQFKDLNDRLSNLELWDSVKVFQAAAQDMQMKNIYSLRNDRKMSVPGIQEEMASIAMDLSERVKLSESELFAIHLWRVTNAKLRDVLGGDADLRELKHIGWVGKVVCLKAKFGEEAVAAGAPGVLKACLNWDRVGPQGAGQIFYEKRGPEVAKATEAEKYVANPPEGTRARARADFVSQHHIGEVKVTSMRWPFVKIKGDNITETINLHPYQTVAA